MCASFFCTRRCSSSVERWSRVSRNVRRMVSRCAVCFKPTPFKCRWRISSASRTIWRERLGWSSIRFCSMAGRKCQDTTGILKMKFIFRTPPALAYNRRFPMSSIAEVSIPSTRRPAWARRLLWFSGLLLLLVAALGGYAFYAVHSALPLLDGSMTVRGLSAPVTVARDGHGVPAIDAASLDDLFFAQGYVTAQDRLWQMDVMRRFAAGELSEILGQEMLA